MGTAIWTPTEIVTGMVIRTMTPTAMRTVIQMAIRTWIPMGMGTLREAGIRTWIPILTETEIRTPIQIQINQLTKALVIHRAVATPPVR